MYSLLLKMSRKFILCASAVYKCMIMYWTWYAVMYWILFIEGTKRSTTLVSICICPSPYMVTGFRKRSGIRLVTHVCGEYRILDTEFEKMLCNQCEQLLLDNYELIPDTTHHVTLTTRQLCQRRLNASTYQVVNTDSTANASTVHYYNTKQQCQPWPRRWSHLSWRYFSFLFY